MVNQEIIDLISQQIQAIAQEFYLDLKQKKECMLIRLPQRLKGQGPTSMAGVPTLYNTENTIEIVAFSSGAFLGLTHFGMQQIFATPIVDIKIVHTFETLVKKE